MHRYDKDFWNIPDLTKRHLSQNIQDHVKEGILVGILKPGERIPPFRTLSRHINVDVSTVRRAYGKLQEQGWLQTGVGVGTTVSPNFPGHERIYPDAKFVQQLPTRIRVKDRSWKFNSGVQNFLQLGFDTLSPVYFPVRQFYSYLNEHRKLYIKSSLTQQVIDTQGQGFKECVLKYLNTQRHFAIKSQNLQVIFGRKESLDVVLKVMLEPGDVLINTSPRDLLLEEVLEHNGVNSFALDITSPEFLQNLEQFLSTNPIKVLYIRPQCTYPEGATVDTETCTQLIQLAKQHHFYIIEEDDHHEFWYKLPYKPLVRYEHDGHVIYLGAFSQLHTYLRNTRTLVAAAEFIQVVQELGIPGSPFRDVLAERAFIDLVESGKLVECIRKARVEKRVHCYQCYWIMTNYFNEKVTVSYPDHGLNLWLAFQVDTSLKQVILELEEVGEILCRPESTPLPPEVTNISIGFGTWGLSEAERWAKELKERLDI